MEFYLYKCVVRRIIDGDTIVVDIDQGFNDWKLKQHIRLYGINTPETRTKDLVEKAAGLKAKDFVNERIKPGDTIVMRTIENNSGKYGRILGIIYYLIDDETYININKELLENKLAKIY